MRFEYFDVEHRNKGIVPGDIIGRPGHLTSILFQFSWLNKFIQGIYAQVVFLGGSYGHVKV